MTSKSEHLVDLIFNKLKDYKKKKLFLLIFNKNLCKKTLMIINSVLS